MKTSEEKEMKSKNKKIEKKLKKVEEKEAQIKVDINNFERSKKEKVEKDYDKNFNPILCPSPSQTPSQTPPLMPSPPRLSFTPPIPPHTPPSTQLPQCSTSSSSSEVDSVALAIPLLATDSPKSETKFVELDEEELDKLIGKLFAKEKARRTAEFERFHS